MSARASARPQLRRLGPADAPAVACVAASAFQQSAFYTRALGLSERQFVAYWSAFFRLALEDANSRVFAIQNQSGEVLAAVAVAYQGFPHPVTGLRFVVRLLRGIGPAACIRYLGFARAYLRVMHRSERERRHAACALWLFVRPDAQRQWLGSTLARDAMAAVGREGKWLVTGFVDASDEPLLALYRRLGFTISQPFPFRGRTGATIELRCAAPEGAPC